MANLYSLSPPQFDLDSIWTFIFGVPASSGTVVSSIHNVCTEAAFLLLGMLRSMLNSVSSPTHARLPRVPPARDLFF